MNIYFTEVLVRSIGYSQWCIFHSRFAFDAVPKYLHRVQRQFSSLCADLSIVCIYPILDSGLMSNFDHYIRWMTCNMNQLMFAGGIVVGIFVFALFVEELCHRICLIILCIFHCHLTNRTLHPSQLNVEYCAGWWLMHFDNSHLCHHLKWSIRNSIDSDNRLRRRDLLNWF